MTAYSSFRRTWLDDAKPGDVIRFKSGALRTALRVLYADGLRRRGQLVALPEGLVWGIQFPILRCSWTKRGHTGMCRSVLLERAVCITRAHIDLRKFPVAQALIRDLDHPCPKEGAHHEPGAACCDVIGVFE